MKKDEGYELNGEYHPDIIQFRFTSIGDKGPIKKIIEFKQLPNTLGRWNLGFGDVKGDDWDDNVISDNNDLRIVLQTVANAVHLFYTIYPNVKLLIVPLDYQRKLLYNRTFQQKWLEIESIFNVIGCDLTNDTNRFQPYNPRKIYDFFVINLKS